MNRKYKYFVTTLEGFDIEAAGERNMKLIARIFEGKKLIFKPKEEKK